MPLSCLIDWLYFKRIVGAGHVGKARPEPIIIRSNQRVVAEQIDVIGDQHEIAGLPVGIHSAAGIRHDQ